MKPHDNRFLERLLRGNDQQPPPDDLLAKLRSQIPHDTKTPDLRSVQRDRYFGKATIWLTAASLAMLFTFTFLISRITFLDQATEPDIATIIEQQRRATKISESAAEETPVGAAARRRPPAETPNDVVTPQPQSSAPENDTSVSAHPATAEAAEAKEERSRLEPAAAPPPPPAAARAIATARPAVIERARLEQSLTLPAELRVTFTVDPSGIVTDVSIDTTTDVPSREEVESTLREWVFERGRPGTFELLVSSADLQPESD